MLIQNLWLFSFFLAQLSLLLMFVAVFPCLSALRQTRQPKENIWRKHWRQKTLLGKNMRGQKHRQEKILQAKNIAGKKYQQKKIIFEALIVRTWLCADQVPCLTWKTVWYQMNKGYQNPYNLRCLKKPEFLVLAWPSPIKYWIVCLQKRLVSAKFWKHRRTKAGQFWLQWKYIKSAKMQQEPYCSKVFARLRQQLLMIISCHWPDHPHCFQGCNDTLLDPKGVQNSYNGHRELVQPWQTLHIANDFISCGYLNGWIFSWQDETSCWEISGGADIGQQTLLGWQHGNPELDKPAPLIIRLLFGLVSE